MVSKIAHKIKKGNKKRHCPLFNNCIVHILSYYLIYLLSPKRSETHWMPNVQLSLKLFRHNTNYWTETQNNDPPSWTHPTTPRTSIPLHHHQLEWSQGEVRITKVKLSPTWTAPLVDFYSHWLIQCWLLTEPDSLFSFFSVILTKGWPVL